jgi:hypothetical protein
MIKGIIKQIPKRPRLRPVCEFTTANHRDGATNNRISSSIAKAAQSAGLGAALFMGIGGPRGGKMGANGKMQSIWMDIFQRIIYCIAVSVVTLCVIWRLNIGISTEESSNLWVIHFPWKRPELGGGYGFYHIDKLTMNIIKVMFYK